MDIIAKILGFISSLNILEIVGFVYVLLQGLRLVLVAIKGVLGLIPGDQGEAFIDKLSGIIDVIENFLSRFIPKAKK